MSPSCRFKRVYRAFDLVGFDPRKRAEVLAERGFDLGFISRMFLCWVLERQDTRDYDEIRYQAIGELLGMVYVAVYTRSERRCRLMTAWEAEHEDRVLWYGSAR